MRSIIFLGLLAASAALSSALGGESPYNPGGTQSHAPASPSHAYYCTYDDQAADGKATRYITGLVSSTRRASDLGSEFGNYVKTTYHPSLSRTGSCRVVVGKIGHGKWESEHTPGASGVKIVDVAWKGAGTQTPALGAPHAQGAPQGLKLQTTSATASAAIQDPNVHTYFCMYDDRSAGGKIVRYMSGLFQSARVFGELQVAFGQYVETAYRSSGGNGSCTVAIGQYGEFLWNGLIKNSKADKSVTLIQVDWKG